MGFQIVIFLAGLKAIPRTYYEAAAIDGAGAWRVLFEITLPSLRPTLVFLVVTSPESDEPKAKKGRLK